jgi:plasmid stabilization system protein ParE
MSREFIITPAAEQDLNAAYLWYESKRAGLGKEFISCVDEQFLRIRNSPESLATTYKEVRQALIRRFPYVVCYTCDRDVVRVIAVFHGHRDPTAWQSRVT